MKFHSILLGSSAPLSSVAGQWKINVQNYGLSGNFHNQASSYEWSSDSVDFSNKKKVENPQKENFQKKYFLTSNQKGSKWCRKDGMLKLERIRNTFNLALIIFP